MPVLRSVLFGALILGSLRVGATQVQKYGVFYGTLQLQPLGDGIHMQVVQVFSYSDTEGHSLGADKGFVTDGASIPRVFWSIVGGPFDGKYVGAAVIHDVGCTNHKYTWEITDRMFYYAMLDLGVESKQAKLMYWAVRKFGPHWETKKIVAATDEALQQKIKESNPIQIKETSGITGKTQKTAIVVIQLPSVPVSRDEAISFEKELTRRESTDNPITIQEIDNRTSQ
jgi:hypothetical protein